MTPSHSETPRYGCQSCNRPTNSRSGWCWRHRQSRPKTVRTVPTAGGQSANAPRPQQFTLMSGSEEDLWAGLTTALTALGESTGAAPLLRGDRSPGQLNTFALIFLNLAVDRLVAHSFPAADEKCAQAGTDPIEFANRFEAYIVKDLPPQIARLTTEDLEELVSGNAHDLMGMEEPDLNVALASWCVRASWELPHHRGEAHGESLQAHFARVCSQLQKDNIDHFNDQFEHWGEAVYRYSGRAAMTAPTRSPRQERAEREAARRAKERSAKRRATFVAASTAVRDLNIPQALSKAIFGEQKVVTPEELEARARKMRREQEIYRDEQRRNEEQLIRGAAREGVSVEEYRRILAARKADKIDRQAHRDKMAQRRDTVTNARYVRAKEQLGIKRWFL